MRASFAPCCPLAAPLLLSALLLSGCSAPSPFSVSHARAHLNVLADSIGSRPLGSPANARARDYVVEQLESFGFHVRVQEVDAARPEHGATARVANVIAVKPGARDDAVGLLAHYDSTFDSPGGADDGLGAAVALEAARALAARPDPTSSLMVLLTDGEEAAPYTGVGLMGAAALVEDGEVRRRLRAYLNLESTGAAGPFVLFEAGPGNGWLVDAWARHADRPRGSSYAIEIYKRLPNDTDFSIVRRTGVPGLNFAAVGDGFAYHTSRDTADRVTDDVLEQAGRNVVSIVHALDNADLATRGDILPVFFDVGGRWGVSYGPATSLVITVAGTVLSLVALTRILVHLVRARLLVRALASVAWSVLGIFCVGATTAGAIWALRAGSDWLHPWYAHPGLMVAAMLATALLTASLLLALARLGPRAVRPVPHPSVIWAMTLPVWLAAAVLAQLRVPAAAHLWTIPLLTAGLALNAIPLRRVEAVRAASVLVLAVAATLWIPDLVVLLEFAVGLLGRLPIVTPVGAYPGLLVLGAFVLAPPLLAVVAPAAPRLRSRSIVAGAALTLLIAGILAQQAPAYTEDRPLRRTLRFVQDGTVGPAYWEMAANEARVEPQPGAPEWRRTETAARMSAPLPPLRGAFRWRAPATPDTRPPLAEMRARLRPSNGGIRLSITVRPRVEGLQVVFRFPAAASPTHASLPGVFLGDRWEASFMAPPAEGIEFDATFAPNLIDDALDGSILLAHAGVPSGDGWQRLPPWADERTTAWRATSVFILPLRTTVEQAGGRIGL